MPRIVFMGSPDFAVPSLDALVLGGVQPHPNTVQPHPYTVVGVVTQPDRPAGRGGSVVQPAVKQAALRLGIPVIQPEKLRQPEAMEQLQAWAPDLIVVAAFGQILRPAVLELPRLGCINVHGSLLPRWRGAAPIQAAILAGDKETGITIMKMDSGVDTGPMLGQRAIPILPDDTGGSLFVKMSILGADLLLETLPRYLGGELAPQPQPEESATYAPMLKKEDGLLNFAHTALELERRVRAMNPWPGAYFDWKGALLKVHRARVNEEKSPGVGHRVIVQGWPSVGTSEGILILEDVQPAGKRSMPGKAFLAGAKDWHKADG